MRCRLCGNERKLVDSHIIPEWAYTKVYGSKGTFNPILFQKKTVGPPRQSGFKEPLLCERCDNQVVGKYENYTKHLFVSIANDQYRNIKKQSLPGGYYVLGGVDYHKLKMCLLSVLWRMHVSTLPSFNGYKTEHEQRLREIILAESPVPPKSYPIHISKLILNGSFLNDVFLTFQDTIEIAGIRRLRVIFKGIIVDYFMTDNCLVEPINLGAISPAGEVLVLTQDINTWKTFPEIQQLLNLPEVERYFKDES